MQSSFFFPSFFFSFHSARGRSVEETEDSKLKVRPPPLEWISSPPLVTTVIITTKGDESPGSSRMGVIGALVIFFSIGGRSG